MGANINRPDGEYRVDPDITLTANSDSRVPSQKAVKAYVASNAAGTTNHSELTSESRALADQHPIAAITDLLSALGYKIMYNVAGTYTVVVPAWANYIYGTGCAGGGGGNASHGLGGGGGQSTVRARLPVVAGETLTLVIGAAGLGATTNATSNDPSTAPGTNGGNTTITGSVSGLILTLIGGKGGGTGNSTTMWQGGLPGGPGATPGSMRTIMTTGTASTYSWVGGLGGASMFGRSSTPGYYSDTPAFAKAAANAILNGEGGAGGGSQSPFSTDKAITAAANGGDGLLLIEFAKE